MQWSSLVDFAFQKIIQTLHLAAVAISIFVGVVTTFQQRLVPFLLYREPLCHLLVLTLEGRNDAFASLVHPVSLRLVVLVVGSLGRLTFAEKISLGLFSFFVLVVGCILKRSAVVATGKDDAWRCCVGCCGMRWSLFFRCFCSGEGGKNFFVWLSNKKKGGNDFSAPRVVLRTSTTTTARTKSSHFEFVNDSFNDLFYSKKNII